MAAAPNEGAAVSKRTAKLWLTMAGFVGVAAMPCPECGTPMILHVWPLVGLVLVARAVKNRRRTTGEIDPEIMPAEDAPPVSSGFREGRCDWDEDRACPKTGSTVVMPPDVVRKVVAAE